MATFPVMSWLAEGLPLTLLCDLVSTADPQSQTINLSERSARDALDPLLLHHNAADAAQRMAI